MALININRTFIKIPWNKRASSYYILLLLNTFFYTLIFDEPRLSILGYSQQDAAVIILCTALFNLILFFLLMLSKWLFVIINPVLFYIGSLGVTYADKFHLDTNILSAPKFILHDAITSPVLSDFKYNTFITLMVLTGLLLGLIRFFFAKDNSVVRLGQIFAFIFIISTITYTFLHNNYSQVKMQPYAFISGIKDYTVTYVINSLNTDKRKDMVEAKKVDDNITGIVILIEKLSNIPFKQDINKLNIIDKDNIIFFNNVKSEFLESIYSRTAVMTGASADNMKNYTEGTSFLSVLQNAGYNTQYIELYNSLLAKDSLNYHIMKHDTNNFIEIETDNSPNIFRSITYISQFINQNNGGIIVVNAEGIPPLIDIRYKDFMQLYNNNEYKNYISYINAYINELIKLLNKKDAFIIIYGLEGETYENNISLNSNESTMIMWISDNLENKYNTKTKIKSHKNDKIYDSTLYNTVLGCFELKSNDIDMDRNLCRK